VFPQVLDEKVVIFNEADERCNEPVT